MRRPGTARREHRKRWRGRGSEYGPKVLNLDESNRPKYRCQQSHHFRRVHAVELQQIDCVQHRERCNDRLVHTRSVRSVCEGNPALELLFLRHLPASRLEDTVNMTGFSTVEIDFVANDPGPTPLHCHHQDHQDEGFMGLVTYL